MALLNGSMFVSKNRSLGGCDPWSQIRGPKIGRSRLRPAIFMASQAPFTR
jgi:hypothetical protein